MNNQEYDRLKDDVVYALAKFVKGTDLNVTELNLWVDYYDDDGYPLSTLTLTLNE